MIILTISKYKAIRQRVHTRQGFLLIELMVGLLVLLLSIMLLCSYQGLIIVTQYNFLKRWQAVNELHSFLAKVTFDSSLLKKKDYNRNDVTITWSLDSYQIKKQHDFKLLKKPVHLVLYTVEWKGWGNKKEILKGSSGVPM